MYPSGYHIGSAYQPRVRGYLRRMKVMALHFCHGQVVKARPAAVSACCRRMLPPHAAAATCVICRVPGACRD
jgi:hypothetical protein